MCALLHFILLLEVLFEVEVRDFDGRIVGEVVGE